MAINGASEHSFKASVDIAADGRTKINRILNDHQADSLGPLSIEAVAAPWWRPERTPEQRVLPEGPRAQCFPSDDPRFAARAQALFDACRTNELLATAVEALLRGSYPLAVIRPRDELAAIDGRRVWYAFRDGSLVPVDHGEAP